MSQQQRNEIFRVASSDDASQADDKSILMMVSAGDGTEERTLRALRRTSRQLDGILRDLSKEISRQSANPASDDGEAEMSDDEEHGEKQLKVELDSTVLPSSEGNEKEYPRKKSKIISREVTVKKHNKTSTPSPVGGDDLEQPEQHPDANTLPSKHPVTAPPNQPVEKFIISNVGSQEVNGAQPNMTSISLPVDNGDLEQPEQHPEDKTRPLNQVIENPEDDFIPSGASERTAVSVQGKSICQDTEEQSCHFSSGDFSANTNGHGQESTALKASHKNILLKWILAFCLLFVCCIGVVLVLMLSHGAESTETPMETVQPATTSSIPPLLSHNSSDTEDTLEAQMPTISPKDNQTSLSENSQSYPEDQPSPSTAPVQISDQLANDDRFDIVPKGYHPKKPLGNRR